MRLFEQCSDAGNGHERSAADFYGRQPAFLDQLVGGRLSKARGFGRIANGQCNGLHGGSPMFGEAQLKHYLGANKRGGVPPLSFSCPTPLAGTGLSHLFKARRVEDL